MAKTASDILVEILIDWGVEVVFGIPGDGINGIIEALRKQQDKIRFIQVRHEESAAFAACGYAKFTGKLGVCLATSGPGGIHLLNGLYDAKMDGQPVLALTGMQFHDLINTYTQQDVELDRLYENVAVYNARVMGAAHVENVTNLAIRSALSRRGVAHITIPVDVQEMAVNNRNLRNVKHHTSEIPVSFNFSPDSELISEAAKILNSGKKVAILAGRGSLGATDELEMIAELLGAPIIKALLGKAAVPDNSPYTTGGIGLLGTLPSQNALEDCDTLLIVGSSFPYIEFLPKPGQARAVQIEMDPVRIGLRYPVEVGLVGDSKVVLKMLIPMLWYKEDRSFLKKAQKGMIHWQELMAERETSLKIPMKPQVIAAEIGKRLDDNAIVTSDSGTITTWWARHFPVKRGQMYSLSGNLATMANGFPYAIAAQIAFPERQVVAFVGDGGFSMLMAELATCVKYNLPIKIIVVKNNTLGQIKWEQMVFLGNPEYGCDLQPINFSKLAEAFGITGVTVEDPKDCASVATQALSMAGPVLIEAVVDPFEPPMPAKVTLKQAAKFAESLARGEPHRAEIAITVLSDKVRELI
ncbi:MAG: thiamine pyrophosphate-dependent enzyme [Pseudobdellovibrionaceae bacterium]